MTAPIVLDRLGAGLGRVLLCGGLVGEVRVLAGPVRKDCEQAIRDLLRCGRLQDARLERRELLGVRVAAGCHPMPGAARGGPDDVCHGIDAMVAQLIPQPLGEDHLVGLRRRVDGQIAGALQPGEGGDQCDGAAAAVAHACAEVLGQQCRREAVHRDVCAMRVPVEGEEWAIEFGGRVVDKHADVEVRGVRGDEVGDIVLGQVGGDAARRHSVLSADRRGGLLEGVGSPGEKHDVEAETGRLEGERGAEPGRCAGDKHPSAIALLHAQIDGCSHRVPSLGQAPT